MDGSSCSGLGCVPGDEEIEQRAILVYIQY